MQEKRGLAAAAGPTLLHTFEGLEGTPLEEGQEGAEVPCPAPWSGTGSEDQ